MNAIDFLNARGIPTNSFVAAGQHMSQNLPQGEDALKIVKELTGVDLNTTGRHPLYATFTAAYAVQILVRATLEGQVLKAMDLLAAAEKEAREYTDPNGRLAWTLAGFEDQKAEIENADPEVVKAGKAKKGARKVLALKVFNEQIAGKVEAGEMTRKEAIAILMTEIGLSAAGASTYYANFKSGKWA
jgi:hypothetical protein